MKYVVTVTRTDTYEKDIEVEAANEEQAQVMAEEQAAAIELPEWEFENTEYTTDEIREGTLDDEDEDDDLEDDVEELVKE